ncbi:MAG: DUF4124 domain-containing protein [Burkholderiaceae bacterium]|nr:DUF4124 domain-containing protein [Burkholderiaceae bacterium]
MGALAAETAGSIYTCVDANGRRITSDRPIPACLDREQRELGATGTVRRVIGPSLTEHERAQLEAQKRKQEEERNRIADERRRERVLISRYPDRAAHDAERAAALESVDVVTATAVKRIDELKERRKALDSEMEFYQKDPAKAPMKLRRELASNEADIEEQQRFIAGQDQEKQRIHKRFDAELAQLRQLWAARAAVPAVLPGGAAAAAAR